MPNSGNYLRPLYVFLLWNLALFVFFSTVTLRPTRISRSKSKIDEGISRKDEIEGRPKYKAFVAGTTCPKVCLDCFGVIFPFPHSTLNLNYAILVNLVLVYL